MGEKEIKPGMNYIQLINLFWLADKVCQFSGNESKLYFGLMDKCNRLQWKNPFGESERYLAEQLGMSVNTIRHARKRLIQSGLIIVTMPEKGSKSVNGQAFYFLTAAKIEAVEEVEPLQNLQSTAAKFDTQPLQNLQSTAAKIEANNKPSLKQKNSFYKQEIEMFYDEKVLKVYFNNVQNRIQYDSMFKGKAFTWDEYNSFLQNYLPEEISNVFEIAADRKHRDSFEQKTIPEMLNVVLPFKRKELDETISTALKGCSYLLKMPKQLTVREKFMLLNKKGIEDRDIKQAILSVEDQPTYRKGNSVFEAVKTNLIKSNIWI